MTKEAVLEKDGIVKQALPNATFKVAFEGKHEVLAYMSGKMKKNYIRILPGDSVKVSISVYDTKRGRITYRYR